MIRLFLLLVIIGAAMVCGPLLAGNKGYVLIAIGDYTIEMTVISAGILALLLYGVLWCTERLLLRLFHIKGSTRRWFSERRRRKARERAAELLQLEQLAAELQARSEEMQTQLLRTPRIVGPRRMLRAYPKLRHGSKLRSLPTLREMLHRAGQDDTAQNDNKETK